MCGFVVVIDNERDVDAELLVKMRDSISHRGPDEEGIWLSADRHVGLGTRRLKIIDLIGGQQPMVTGDGSFAIAYNGEVYNHRSIRQELERAGRRFRTRCDTEVVLAAYEAYGDECLERLDGMFAFAIWDQHRRRLFFARDRGGEKPLYYAESPKGLLIASEIKALLEHPDIGRSVDLEALGYYLTFLTTPPPSTLFAGIFKLAAAHCGSWTADQGLRTWRWWALPSREPIVDASDEELADELRELFHASVEERMMSDVPVGVYLSGGIDSSANVAFMSRHSRNPVRTFSVAFADEPSLDELSHARAVSEYFGTDHHEVVLRDEDVIACLPELIHHQDEPLADSVCVPLFHLARVTRESGVTVVQVGEGSDESFFGYPMHDEAVQTMRKLRYRARLLPRALLRAGYAGLAPLIDETRYELTREALIRGIVAPHAFPGFSQRGKRRLLVDGNSGSSAIDYIAAQFGTARTDDQIALTGLAHEFGLRMPELLLMRIDKMTMASSVEARAPFLDPQLVEFAARLPLSLHLANGSGKRILKHALSTVVPEFVLARPKQGFGAPTQRWLSSLQVLAQRELLRDQIFEYFHEPAVRKVLGERPTSRSGVEFWVLLNFALWHRHWIEKEDLREPPIQQTALRTGSAASHAGAKL
jgi:asparagine synthase (glutamine-hydrolysing)